MPSSTLDGMRRMGEGSRYGMRASIEPTLASLPSEIIELIAFYCANDISGIIHPNSARESQEVYATPPFSLRNLLVTNHKMYSLLDSSQNSQLYARIFRSKFDVEAIARRFGSAAISSKSLTKELKKRCIYLKRIRRAVTLGRLFPDGDSQQARIELEENLWLAYMMMMENDGQNYQQLRWAHLEAYLSLHHTQEMLEAAFRPEYPQDTPDRALALHLYHLISDPDRPMAENRNESDEKLFVLRPFIFAAHRYDAFYAPWTTRSLPSQITNSELTEHEMATNPFFADLRLRSRYQKIEHCDQQLTICPPNLTHAACFSFFMKVEKDPAVTVLDLPEDPQIVAEAMMGRSRRRGSDTEEQSSARNPLTYSSKDHDRDMQRLMCCTSPQQSPGLKTFFHLGDLEGSWEGRFTYFDFDSYRDMLGGKLRSLYEGQFGEQPQVWKIKEHIVRLESDESPGGRGDTLNSGYFAENDEPTDRETLSLSDAKARFATASQSLPHDLHLYPTFDDDDEMDTKMGYVDDEEDRYEILLSGTGHSAWGTFMLRGRVRSWDGMIIMTKEYRPEVRGRWLYRGYVVAGGRMVGRWRDTFTPEEMSGYEGCFLLHRRVE